MAERVLRR